MQWNISTLTWTVKVLDVRRHYNVMKSRIGSNTSMPCRHMKEVKMWKGTTTPQTNESVHFTRGKGNYRTWHIYQNYGSDHCGILSDPFLFSRCRVSWAGDCTPVNLSAFHSFAFVHFFALRQVFFPTALRCATLLWQRSQNIPFLHSGL